MVWIYWIEFYEDFKWFEKKNLLNNRAGIECKIESAKLQKKTELYFKFF